ncbi:MAG: 2-oxoacid:acceptor oxidoreductase family protein [Desulfurococcaceae archaeon]
MCYLLYEIVFHGRGGQGAVTASNILVQAAIFENLYGQSFPFFGAERRGAPVVAYARISDKPIMRHSNIREADVVVVLDSSLLKLGVVRKTRIKNNGILIVNTEESTVDKTWFSSEDVVRVYVVNATKVAIELGLVLAGWPLVNTPMLGAISKALGIISMNSVEKAIIEYFGEKAGRKNVEAAFRAYNETKYLGEVI